MRDDYARFGNRQGSSDSPSRRRNQDPRDANSHPGMANYPTGGAPRDPLRASGSSKRDPGRASGSSNRYLPPLGQERREESRRRPSPEREIPPKLTVTRVAAMRSREMGSRMYGLFHKAATADGADKSGLTALTYPVMANFAVDAAMAVALANTLFFAAATAESKSKVALYLLITIAPFAVIAPLIGPALDRLQHGRRAALAA
ncbi:MAG: MFS transporter, partial [[Mycobacterium] stephanolepidis]